MLHALLWPINQISAPRITSALLMVICCFYSGSTVFMVACFLLPPLSDGYDYLGMGQASVADACCVVREYYGSVPHGFGINRLRVNDKRVGTNL